MTPVEPGKLNIAAVMAAEIRVRRMGPAPMQGSRVVLLNGDGISISSSLFSIFSPRTLKLMDALCASIEADYIDRLSQPEIGGELEEVEEEGPNFG